MASLLNDYLKKHGPEPFAWGTSDCFTFAVGWVEAVTGISALALWAGLYHDEASCKAFIRNGSGENKIAHAFLETNYGAQKVKSGHGIIVLAKLAGITGMGVRIDELRLVFKFDRGLFVTRRAKVLAEWGVSCHNF